MGIRDMVGETMEAKAANAVIEELERQAAETHFASACSGKRTGGRQGFNRRRFNCFGRCRRNGWRTMKFSQG